MEIFIWKDLFRKLGFALWEEKDLSSNLKFIVVSTKTKRSFDPHFYSELLFEHLIVAIKQLSVILPKLKSNK